MILDMLKKQNKKEDIVPEEKVEESINEGTLLDVLTSIESELKESLSINEETAGSAFTKNMVPESEAGDNIYQILDGCARQASAFYKMLEARIKRGKGNFDSIQASGKTNTFNPLFIGPTGTGKTSIVKAWAKDKGYELVTLNMMGDALDFLGVKTINKDYDLTLDDEGNTKKTNRVETIPTKVFDKFLTGKTKVLFLDEINKTNPRILQALYDLISFHTVQNGDEVMFLPKLLFTVGAMNPSEYGNREPLDPALKARMEIYPVTYDSISLKKYLLKEIEESIDTAKEELSDLKDDRESDEAKFWASQYEEYSGKKDLVEKLFEDPKKFIWSDPEKLSDGGDTTLALVPRTLEAALNNCDGTKTGLLKAILLHCGMEAFNMIKDILNNYQDKEHKANLIWGKDYSVKEEPETEEDEDEVLDREEDEEDVDLRGGSLNDALADILRDLGQ